MPKNQRNSKHLIIENKLMISVIRTSINSEARLKIMKITSNKTNSSRNKIKFVYVGYNHQVQGDSFLKIFLVNNIVKIVLAQKIIQFKDKLSNIDIADKKADKKIHP